MRRKRCPAPLLSRSSRLSRGVSQRPSIRLGQHQSWQLLTVSKIFPACLKRNGLEFALRNVAAEHSESPIYLVLPALRISSRAGMDSVRGVSIEISNLRLEDDHVGIPLTGVNPVQIVQIRCKAKSLNSSFDVLLDMRGGVGDGAIPSHDVEPTLGGNYQ